MFFHSRKRNRLIIALLSIFLFVMFIAMPFSQSEASTKVVNIKTVRGEPGDNVSVAVTASSINMAGFFLVINYDPDYLKPISAEKNVFSGSDLIYNLEHGTGQMSFTWWHVKNVNVNRMFSINFEILKELNQTTRITVDSRNILTEILDENTDEIDVTYRSGGVRGPLSKDGDGGACYIATSVYGDYDAGEVIVLRKFRDEVLQNSLPGRLFIKTYYTFSPPVARYLENKEDINIIVKNLLDRFVGFLIKKQ